MNMMEIEKDDRKHYDVSWGDTDSSVYFNQCAMIIFLKFSMICNI